MTVSPADLATRASRVSTRRRDAGPTRHEVVPLVLGTAVLAGLAALTYTWWTDNPRITADRGNELLAAGRLFGLYGGFLAGVAILLMARVPWLDRTIGTDRLARVHAMLGRSVLGALTCHATLIVLGETTVAHTGIRAEIKTLWKYYPHVPSAVAAISVLLVVGITSARMARSRLPYEVWHLLHLANWAAVWLAFGHAVANGADLAGHSRNRLVWKSWFLGLAVVFVLFRIVVPLTRALLHRTVIAAVTPESDDVVSIRMTGRNMQAFGGRAGQFVRVRFLTRGRWWQSHPYSMSTAPDPDAVRVTVKGCGRHTAGLRELSPGTRVLLSGPYGGLVATRRTRRAVVLIAGGIGITPMRALFETLPAANGRLVLLYRAAREEDLVLRAELDALAAARGGIVHHLVGPRPDDPADEPLGADRLRELVPDIAARDVFVCGPPAMMAAVTRTAIELGVPRRSVHSERFSL